MFTAWQAFATSFAWVFKKPIGGQGGNLDCCFRVDRQYRRYCPALGRILSAGHRSCTLSNLYESLVFFAWTIIVLYLVIERKYQNRVIGAFATPLAFLAMAYASLSPNISDRIQPLIPALKSNWLIAHVMACFIGYAAFAIAFGISIMYLLKQKSSDDKSSLLNLSAGCRSSGRIDPPDGHVRFSFSVHRDYHRSRLGQLRLGPLLGLGPQGDLVADHLVCLRHLAACPYDARMARQAHCLFFRSIGFAAVLFTYFGVNLFPDCTVTVPCDHDFSLTKTGSIRYTIAGFFNRLVLPIVQDHCVDCSEIT